MASTATQQALPRLISFPPSSACENGRWLLHHYGIEYKEERHAPPFFAFALLLNRGWRMPLYRDGKLTLNGLRELFDYFEALAPGNLKLIPAGREDEAIQLGTRYLKDMGKAAVCWAYYHLLPHWRIMVDPLSIGSPAWERLTVKFLYPLPAFFLWILIRLTRKKADASLATLRTVFDEVNQRLADGRPYLMGDRMTIADIAFAVSGAPLVLPLGYGGYPGEQGPLPTFEQAPPAIRAVVEEMRPTKAGQFILRMYREERYR